MKKGSLNLRISQEKLPKLKIKEKKTEQDNKISKDCGTVTKGAPYNNGNTRRRKLKKIELLETIVTENLPKLIPDNKSQIQESQRTHIW